MSLQSVEMTTTTLQLKENLVVVVAAVEVLLILQLD
jgi:hypothetical protein